MITVNDIYDPIKDALNWTSADESRIYKPMSLANWDLCELAPFPKLCRNRAVSFSGVAVNLGNDVVGVTAVVGSDGTPYWEVAEDQVKLTGGRKRWYKASIAHGTSLSTGLNIQIVDANGAAETASPTVYYWVYPPVLSALTDEILLPASRALVINTMLYLMSVIDREPEVADRMKADYETAKAELLAKFRPPARFGGGPR